MALETSSPVAQRRVNRTKPICDGFRGTSLAAFGAGGEVVDLVAAGFTAAAAATVPGSRCHEPIACAGDSDVADDRVEQRVAEQAPPEWLDGEVCGVFGHEGEIADGLREFKAADEGAAEGCVGVVDLGLDVWVGSDLQRPLILHPPKGADRPPCFKYGESSVVRVLAADLKPRMVERDLAVMVPDDMTRSR